jgi:hypothetical protein
MRSPIGSILVLFGVATVVVLVLLLFQTIGLRGDLGAMRSELDTLRTSVESRDEGLSEEDLVARLDELEADIRESLTANGADGVDESPGGSPGDTSVSDRVDEILDRIDALNDRIDEICNSVPVC